ncbi:MAG: COX15/CtaA family protein [Candidatus Korobacteraceae bacterium]
MTNSSSTTFNGAHHRFAVFLALCIFLLILAGASVTSNDAGLSVPDWPTSFGSLYRIPPMVDGVKFEHGHRMIAQFIGLLTIVLAVWTQRVDRRPWMRALGWVALTNVIAQGILGGITVLFKLPPAVSTAHATLAQTFFCVVVSMALFTGREWVNEAPVLITQSERPRLTTLSMLAVCSVYVQLILGAAFRHSGMKLLPHLVSAVVVVAVLLWTCIRVLSQYGRTPQLRKPAVALLVLLFVQLSLGFGSYITRVEWAKGAPGQGMSMVLTTVAHVAVGALVLATAVILAIQARRHTVVQEMLLSRISEAVAA